MLRTLSLTATLAALPAIAFAVGDEDDAPPTPTPTTTECTDGKVFDTAKGTCENPQSGALDDDTLYDAVREFAYAGQYDNARRALAAMSNQASDRVLTYRGFIHRKLGQRDESMHYYQAALTANPDNLLARSYMGQGLVAEGDLAAALAQWKEITARGGTGTWPEIALRRALETGHTTSY